MMGGGRCPIQSHTLRLSGADHTGDDSTVSEKRPNSPERGQCTCLLEARSSSDRTYLQTMLGLSLASSRHAWCCFCFRAASPTLSDPFEIVTLVTTGSTAV